MLQLRVKVKGREYRQQTFEYVLEPKPDLKPGDWVQRFLAPKEALLMAEMDAKRQRKLMGRGAPNVFVLRRKLEPVWRKKTVQYVSTDGRGDTLRVFNAVDAPVPLTSRAASIAAQSYLMKLLHVLGSMCVVVRPHS